MHRAQKERHFSPSPGMFGAGSKVEYLEALIHLPAVGYKWNLKLYSTTTSVTPSTLELTSMVVEEKPGGLFLYENRTMTGVVLSF